MSHLPDWLGLELNLDMPVLHDWMEGREGEVDEWMACAQERHLGGEWASACLI